MDCAKEHKLSLYNFSSKQAFLSSSSIAKMANNNNDVFHMWFARGKIGQRYLNNVGLYDAVSFDCKGCLDSRTRI